MRHSLHSRAKAAAAAAALLAAAVLPLAARPEVHAEDLTASPATDAIDSGLGLVVAAAFDRVLPGAPFTYTLTYSNTSAVPVPDATLTAALSSGQVQAGGWVGVPPLPGDSHIMHPATGVHEWRLGELGPGQAGRIHLYVHVAERPRPAVTLPVLGIGASGRLSSDSASFPAREGLAQAIVLGPILRLVKAGPREVYPGRPLVYTLTLTSHGAAANRPDGIPATLPVITEQLPANTTFLEGSAPAEPYEQGRRVRWHLPDALMPDTAVAVTMALRADPAAEPGDVVLNRADRYRVYAPELDPIGFWGQADVRTTVLNPAEARVDTGRFLGGRHEAYPGETVTYTLVVRNPEPEPLVGATIVFTLPANTAPETVDDPPYFTFGAEVAGTPPPSVSEGRLEWSGMTLPGWGDTLLVFTASISRQTYTLDRPGGWQYRMGGMTVSHPDAVFPVPSDKATVAVVPAVTLDKAVTPRSTLIRRPVTYTLTLRNRSPYDVGGITVTDTIRAQQPTAPMSFTFQSALGSSPAPDIVGPPPWTWSGLALAAQETRTISYTAIADGLAGMQYPSDLDAYSAETSMPGVRNKAAVTIDSPLGLSAVLTPTESFLDMPVRYALTVENADRVPYQLSRLEAALPAGVRLPSGEALYAADLSPSHELAPGQSWTGEFDAVAGQGISCRNLTTSRSLAAGRVRSYVDEFPAGYYTNRVALASLRLTHNVATVLTATRETALPLDTVTYTVRFDNRSPVPALGHTITVKLPKGFEFLAMVRGGDPALDVDPAVGGPELVWSPVDIPVDGRVWLEFTARASSTPGRYTTTVTEAGEGRTCVEGRNGGRVEVLEPGESFVRLAKRTGEDVLPPGSTVPYEVSFNNQDRDPIHLDIVTDTMPTGFRFGRMLERAGSPPAPEIRGADLVWRDIVIPGRTTRAWSYELQSPVLFGGAYVNLLRVQSPHVPVTRTASVTVSLVPQVLLSKVAGAHDVGPGQIVPYTITVLSNAEERFNKVRITDTLPAALEYVRTVSVGSTLVAVGEGNRRPAWEFDLERHERQIIVFEARVAAQPPGGVHYNRLDGYSPDVAIGSVDRAAPVTVTGAIATPSPTTRPPVASATPTRGATQASTPTRSTPVGTPTPTTPPGDGPTATVESRPVGRLWLPRVLQR